MRMKHRLLRLVYEDRPIIQNMPLEVCLLLLQTASSSKSLPSLNEFLVRKPRIDGARYAFMQHRRSQRPLSQECLGHASDMFWTPFHSAAAGERILRRVGEIGA
jgi:hypothetical protein